MARSADTPGMPPEKYHSGQNIPLARPEITEQDAAAVVSVLNSGVLSRGPAQLRLEKALKKITGAKHAIAVASGTAGLQLCLASQCSPGSKVVTSPFSVPASANAIIAAGCEPVFVDIEATTLAMDPRRTLDSVDRNTSGLLVVHAMGMAAPMAEMRRIARRCNIFLLEDACEAIGAGKPDQRIGNQGDAGVFGFYPNKQIVAGEGGIVVCNDSALAEQLRCARNHGRDDSGDWLDQHLTGHNFRLSELAAALAESQLSRLPQILERRRTLAEGYRQRLEGLPGVRLPAPEHLAEHSWFIYSIQLRGATRSERDQVVERMSAEGIACGRYFAPLHLQPYFRKLLGHSPGDFPITEQIAQESISLPFFHQLRERELDRITLTLAKILSR